MSGHGKGEGLTLNVEVDTQGFSAMSQGKGNADLKIETGYNSKATTSYGANDNSGDWRLKEPEKVNLEREQKNMGLLLDFSRKRVSALNELTDKLHNQEVDFINKQKEYLIPTQNKLIGIANQAKVELNTDADMKSDIQSRISKLENEKRSYSDNAAKADGELAETNQRINKITGDIQSQNQRRKQIAGEIDVATLKKAKFAPDDKSATREVFAWCLVAIYGEPESNFYWENFKNEAFKEKGNDFILRLKGTKVKLNNEQGQYTDKVIKNKAIIEQEVNKNHKSIAPAIMKLFEYIESVWLVHTTHLKLKEAHADQERIQQEADIKRCEHEKYTSQINGFLSRLEMSQRFQNALTSIITNVDKVNTLLQSRLEVQPNLIPKQAVKKEEPVYEKKVEEPSEIQTGTQQSPMKQSAEEEQVEVVHVENHEHKRAHANVKASAHTEFNDEGKRAQSCQECTIF